ncbi:hypothetical protein PIB30_063128 [Stylosanthes scabra]|uniref:Uncharacterized protein n=1 Tax=Stylosanthes scabra TaxID=79078 RepID=A0ABU6XJC6_9FABA|nr:hypothetical protein [Stylosanthes scabra]
MPKTQNKYSSHPLYPHPVDPIIEPESNYPKLRTRLANEPDSPLLSTLRGFCRCSSISVVEPAAKVLRRQFRRLAGSPLRAKQCWHDGSSTTKTSESKLGSVELVNGETATSPALELTAPLVRSKAKSLFEMRGLHNRLKFCA